MDDTSTVVAGACLSAGRHAELGGKKAALMVEQVHHSFCTSVCGEWVIVMIVSEGILAEVIVDVHFDCDDGDAWRS